MKANLKGLGGIKGFFLMHGEKLAIAAVVVCTLLFIYYSTKLERLPSQYQSAELEKRISLTTNSIDSATWGTAVDEHGEEVRLAKPLMKRAELEVDPTHYPISSINPPVVKSVVPRSDPTLLSAVDVRANGGSGLLPFIDEAVMRERDLKRQEQEERKAREQARQLERDQQQQEGGRGPRGRGRGEQDREGMMGGEFDPEHPNRRPLENYGRAPGAMVQGDERIERTFFAVVVAKVPIKEQIRLFRDAFENTRAGYDPQYDSPSYAGFRVERAEVRSGQPLTWSPVGVYDGQGKRLGGVFGGPTLTKLYTTIANEWAAEMPEVVDERYLDAGRALIYPLPPLLGRNWGPEVTHPDIPLAINAPPPEEETDPALQQPTATVEGAEDDFGSRDPSMGGFQAPGGRTMSMPGMSRGGMFGGEEGFRGGGGMRRSPMMMRGGEGGGFRGGGGWGGGMARTGILPKGVTHWLLRFFDFSVEPGKKYKYRVRLALYDPNQGTHIDASTLDSKVVSRLRASAKARKNKLPSPFVESDWSEPSPTVGIPLSGGVRLASAEAPSGKSFNDEPTAKLLVEAFDLDAENNAIQGGVEKELRRGDVANSIEKTEYVTPDGRWIDTQDSFKFLTGITLIDIAGGERTVKEMTSPSRVLLLDPAGELYVREELDDSPAVNMHRTMFAKPDKRRGGERGMERGMRGGRGGFFGEG